MEWVFFCFILFDIIRSDKHTFLLLRFCFSHFGDWIYYLLPLYHANAMGVLWSPLNCCACVIYKD